VAESLPGASPLAVDIDEALVEAVALSGDYAHLECLVADVLSRLGGTDPRREALIRIRAASTRPQDNPDAASAHLVAASTIAEQLAEPELTSRVDAVGARYALVAGELERAEKLASQALAAAEDAGLAGWAADVALESVCVLGRRERIRDPRAARALFERAYKIADERGLGVWQIR
jgi:hypothetical protein